MPTSTAPHTHPFPDGRTPPAQFGDEQPADGAYVPGDNIQASFTEEIRCGVDTIAMLSTDDTFRDAAQELQSQVVCEGRAVVLAVHGSVPYSRYR